MSSMTSIPSNKREGDISDSFASLSGKPSSPLPDRFRQLKISLAKSHETSIITSWSRLLQTLRRENDLISRSGPSIIPSIPYSSNLISDLHSHKSEIQKRGVAVIHGVIPEDEARAYKFEVEEYVRQNPQTKGFPASNPQVLELYWSASQVRARAHNALLETQKGLMSLWRASPQTPVSVKTPLVYADRLRIRQPGDAQFALGPHMDGGSVERWEEQGYGLGGVYNSIFRGEWEEGYDAFDVTGRVRAVTDLYGGLGACSMFRMFQGWMSMSNVKPGEGTLQVYPLVKEGLVYILLRPFFRAKRQGKVEEGYLDVDNWEFTGGEEMQSVLQGATPGHAQEMNEDLHPHLELGRTMVNVPEVRPGDYVVWHCDTIHAVDRTHNGTSDSSVLYIPVCPTTESNARYVVRQRAAFLEGTPAPDFPGGKGESDHIGRPTVDYVKKHCSDLGVQSTGLERLVAVDDDTPGGKEAVNLANKTLGF
ncbi:hypothetical protein QBC38DRAFT_371798 [Podospora fimiseda]|uniref:DUF1479 domain protein n=1 Tax=Podospora fimiseda TaxID=252190 RepID=A0AAN7GZE4_9PEZI|nr:hypothetical protein QBC38DRAFT_371798 [Podospora fimiseda]